MDEVQIVVLITTATAVLSSIVGFIRYRQVLEAEDASKKEVNDAVDKLREAMSLPNLIDLNRKQIDLYHLQTRAQARNSFIWSLFAMFIGLGVLVAGAAVTFQATSTSTKVVSAVLAATGSAFSAYISRTFMQAHTTALDQLNLYFQQPVLSSYLLTAERLLGKMTKSEHDGVYRLIIDHVLAASVPEARPKPGKRAPRRGAEDPAAAVTDGADGGGT